MNCCEVTPVRWGDIPCNFHYFGHYLSPFLPATTIFSSLPFRARSLLGIWILSAITTQKLEWSKRCAFVFGRTTMEKTESSGIPPWHHAVAFYSGDGWGRARGGETAAKTPSVWIFIVRGQRVHCILTSQGVNMTLAQKPTVHRVRERN